MQVQMVPVKFLNLAGSHEEQVVELLQVRQVEEQSVQLAPPSSKNPVIQAQS